MMHFKVISLLAALLVVRVHSLEQEAEAPIPGYTVETISWTVETTPGGPEAVLNGTIQDVYSQLLEINENYEAEFGSIDSRSEQPVAGQVLKRWGDVHCGGFGSANLFRINDGIKYLKGVSGQPTRGPGPGNCARVSCSYNAAIWWCNDNTFTKVLPNFGLIADAAQEIVNNCGGNSNELSGQNFLGGARDWNVVIRNSAC